MNKSNKVILGIMMVLLTTSLNGCRGGAKATADKALKAKADKLARSCIILDTHQDVPYRLQKTKEDISRRTKGGDFDYPRARQGGLDPPAARRVEGKATGGPPSRLQKPKNKGKYPQP